MIAFTLTALSLIVAFPDPPQVELFAKEGWYKDAKAPEQEFAGVLRKTERAKGVVGFGRFNPFRLEMEGDKVREVYVSGNLKILDPYVGKRIKLIGKAIDTKIVGRMHHEIWAASLSVLVGDKKEGRKGDELKIHAKTPAGIAANSMPIRSSE
jgi:hypothetical protein